MKYLSEEDLQKYKLRLLDDKTDDFDNDIIEPNNDLNDLEQFKNTLLEAKELIQNSISFNDKSEKGKKSFAQIELKNKNNKFKEWYIY